MHTKNDNSINSFIGNSTYFSGDIETDGPIRIDGKFKGRIISSGMVYLGRKSLSECKIFARDVIIGGTIKGDIYSENSLKVLKSAEIIGNIYSSTIQMDDGVIFDGECRILSKEEMKSLIDKRKIERI
ncbi:MAG: hypothetical protein A2015_03475 [Spirochaetes bacterium GWF1_31_7]|nr:MAG: hypothetical protein A2Y30_07560 [Spirochaetes bacterium GWE1_32_154]OHD48440.1 MAG: hypothetical protein A2Y29_05435 [Spirochaetes bacterium GWE2_31_10]OHD50917.1 MAG: hypothetical protein A2015_03475 [Spirochaetes bacterium GWF1_31_7]OHD80513.1 MAG: hypothetical protein A2355_01615 [Spirochaetes bacterium RIFOXYB1_FULL_32_8]HBD92869.1 cell division protein [Spirochaetia bacterium]